MITLDVIKEIDNLAKELFLIERVPDYLRKHIDLPMFLEDYDDIDCNAEIKVFNDRWEFVDAELEEEHKRLVKDELKKVWED